MVKVQAIYERPFWRDDGLNGASVADVGPLNITFDSSPESGSPGVLLGFAGGDEARALRARCRPASGARAALGSLARAFGPRALVADRLRRDELVAGDVLARLPGRPSRRRAC